MKKFLSIILIVLVFFSQATMLVSADYSQYEGKWLWEYTTEFIRFGSSDNWYDFDEAYVDIIDISGDKIMFEFSHQKGGVHLVYYEPCVGTISGNTAFAYADIHKGGDILDQFEITLVFNENSIDVNVHNPNLDATVFNGRCYRQEQYTIIAFYRAVIKSFYKESQKDSTYEFYDMLYSLYDVDKDGILELIIDNNQPHSTRVLYFYKFINGELIYMGSYQPGYGVLCENPNGPGVITYHAYKNHQRLDLVTYNGNGFSDSNIVAPERIDDATEYKEPYEMISGANYLESCAVNSEDLLIKVLGNMNYTYVPEPSYATTSFGSSVSEWAVAEVEQAYEDGLIPESLIGDDLTQKVTRAEFAAISVQLYETWKGEGAGVNTSNPFDDIYYNENETQILKAYNLGITDGVGNREFAPDAHITREQLATMLCRTYKKKEWPGWTLDTDDNYTINYSGVAKFADDADISDWAKPSVYFMAKYGVINGVGDNKFAPKNTTTIEESLGYATATREQAILMSLRSFENLN